MIIWGQLSSNTRFSSALSSGILGTIAHAFPTVGNYSTRVRFLPRSFSWGRPVVNDTIPAFGPLASHSYTWEHGADAASVGDVDSGRIFHQSHYTEWNWWVFRAHHQLTRSTTAVTSRSLVALIHPVGVRAKEVHVFAGTQINTLSKVVLFQILYRLSVIFKHGYLG